MSKIIKVEINDEDMKKLKEIYNKDRAKLSSDISSFDDFLDWTARTALKTHIQFAAMNEKMSSLLNLNVDNLGSDFDMSNVSEFINDLINHKDANNSPKKEDKKTSKKKN